MVRVDYPGYFTETLPSGNVRHRVRVQAQPKTKITLPFGPEDRRFHDAYHSARAGIRPDSEKVEIVPNAGTVGWLVTAYLAHLGRMVEAGEASHYTLTQRKGFAKRLLDFESTSGISKGKPWRVLPMTIPQHELTALRDDMMGTPGSAKNMFKFIKAMYEWAVDRGHCKVNPAAGVKVAYKNQGGAVPWSLDDLKRYRETHPLGTPAHLCLSLFMFTACRIGDAYKLGRHNEITRNGQLWLSWQPAKKGSSPVEIPVLNPLRTALNARNVIGPTYLLTEYGKPFQSAEGLRNRLQKWCAEAGLENRSSHGIRKAAGHLLALHGASQYQIMAVHGHANASTSEVYTRSVERIRLGEMGMATLAGLEW